MANVLVMKLFGVFVASLVFGYMHNHCSTRITMFFAQLIGLIGGIGYFIADYLPSEVALWVIFVGRLMEGMRYGGQATTVTSYLSEVVSPDEKGKYLAESGIFALIGFMLGGILGVFFNMGSIQIFGLHFDSYTWPGALQIIIFSAQIGFTLSYFIEMPYSERQGRIVDTYKVETEKPSKAGILVSFFIFSICGITFTLQDTITFPLIFDNKGLYTENSFAWSNQAGYYVQLLTGAVSVCSYILLRVISGRFDDRKILLINLSLGIIGCLLTFDFEYRHLIPAMYLTGLCVISLVSSLNRNVSLSVMSKVIGPYKSGAIIGWSFSIRTLFGACGSYLGVRALYTSLKLGYGVIGGFMLVALILLIVFWKESDKHPYYYQSKKDSQIITNQQ